jgi:hypothetical protein
MSITPYIATPAYGGQCDASYVYGLCDFTRLCVERSIAAKMYIQAGESLISRARNHIVTTFRRTKCSHLCFVDADMGWRGQDLFDMIESDLPVVCGIYPKKGYDWTRMFAETRAGKTETPEEMRRRAVIFNVRLKDEDVAAGRVTRLTTPEGKIFIEAARGATGFMVITRETIEKMIDAYPERRCFDGAEEHYNLFAAGPDPAADKTQQLRALIRDGATQNEFAEAAIALLGDTPTPTENVDYMGEDYAFCRLWTMTGGKIYLYPGAKLTHTGQATFEGDVAQLFTG